MRLQAVKALAETGDGDSQIAQHPRSPYLTAREAIVYLRLSSQSALYHLVREHGLPNCRRGRLYLFDTREIDAWLRGANSALELSRAAHNAHRVARRTSTVIPKSGTFAGER